MIDEILHRGAENFSYQHRLVGIARPSDIDSVTISGVPLIRASGREREQQAPTFIEIKGRPEGCYFVRRVGRSWARGRTGWNFHWFVKPVPHRKPHGNIGMRLSFVHVPGSHEVIAEKDVGLDPLNRVISMLGGGPNLREGSREEYRFLRRQDLRSGESDTPEVDSV